jgi:hypothetical protein
VLAAINIYKRMTVAFAAIVIINWHSMKMLKKLMKFSGRLLIGCMFALCMVVGVVPIIPKRKEQFEIEIKMEYGENKFEGAASFMQTETNE